MKPLRVLSAFYYLTSVGGPTWREVDWTTNRIVKCMKNEPFKGYFTIKFRNGEHKFNFEQRSDVVASLMPSIGRKVGTLHAGPFTIVPIPNSGATIASSAPFRTQELAEMIAAQLPGRVSVVPALRWKEAQPSAHRDGGSRDPEVLLNNLAVVAPLTGPVLLFDDVMTTGGHMVASCRGLTAAGIEPHWGLALGRATLEQKTPSMGWVEELLPIEPQPVDWSF